MNQSIVDLIGYHHCIAVNWSLLEITKHTTNPHTCTEGHTWWWYIDHGVYGVLSQVSTSGALGPLALAKHPQMFLQDKQR